MTDLETLDERIKNAHLIANDAAMDERLDRLIAESNHTLDMCIELFFEHHKVAGIVAMFSGGNDSTTLCHLFRNRVTHYGMANTGVGIEQTRQYVRDTCAAWGVPLIEKAPDPGKGYRDLVMGQVKPGPRGKNPVVWPGGFPGPAAHGMFYQRLKERSFDKIRAELVNNPRREHVIFLAGRRKEESARRNGRTLAGSMAAIERRGSTVWCSPILNWTKLDMNAYRRRFPDVPRNEVSDLLHMSGECLCGCFGHPGEVDEIGMWYPEVAAELHQMEADVTAANLPGVKPEHCTWNWKGQGTCNSGLCNT